ncbi:MAG: RHS repeat-associated core domain-containing protein [Verrucomicrobiaceae bacterium]|nr:MAG: RHS repeat-associated core domain-containing protein [Verrucomicrobiaceae bacterium]
MATTVPWYDLDGNLTNDGRWTYTWDAENRLIQMETTTAATTAGHPYTKLKFVYDWQGRRIARTVWQGGTAGSPTFKSNRRWMYDGWNVIAEFSAADDMTSTVTRLNTFTWGLDLSGRLQGAGGVGGMLLQTAVTGGVMERASYDGNGNIVTWTKSTASAPTSRRDYDAFGNTLVSEGIAPSSFGFSTKMQDAETGLYYYGYRYYDATTGRWPSKDPINEKGGINLYGFIGNDGINSWDLLGLLERTGNGHHLFNFATLRDHTGLSECLKEALEKIKILPKPGTSFTHGYSKAHQLYNERVKESIDRVISKLAEEGLDVANCCPSDLSSVVNRFEKDIWKDDYVRAFNTMVYNGLGDKTSLNRMLDDFKVHGAKPGWLKGLRVGGKFLGVLGILSFTSAVVEGNTEEMVTGSSGFVGLAVEGMNAATNAITEDHPLLSDDVAEDLEELKGLLGD